jgi:predicted Holliday junction resolvase-like endonuclease
VKSSKWKVQQLDIVTLIFGGLLGFVIGIFIMRIISLYEHKGVRRQATQGSRSAIFGEVYEKILPALPNFPYAPKDMVFVGKGCDYIIFDGLSDGHLREIVFLELKSGWSQMNKNEKMIQFAVDHRKVRFSEYRIDSVKNKE